jgi:hypothetical protein
MNCQSFEEVLIDLARSRVPAQSMENLTESARLHLNECTGCASKMDDNLGLTNRLDELAREMKAWATPARVEEEVRKAFGEMLAEPISPAAASLVPVAPGRLIHNSKRWTVAAAAVILLVLGITGLRLRSSWQSNPAPAGVKLPIAQISSQEFRSNLTAGPTSLPSQLAKELAPKSRRKFRNRRPIQSLNRDQIAGQQHVPETTTASTNNNETEVATHFMPIGYAGPINPQDGGQLVRVELQRSAMLSLGLPVNMDRYGERVKADILLGADGLARAIRFVQ